MTLRRLILAGVLLSALAVGIVGTTPATADYHPGDCTWSEQGDVITISGTEYHCACGRLTREDGRSEVFCMWHAVNGSQARRLVVRRRHRKPLFGIGTAVTSVRAVAS